MTGDRAIANLIARYAESTDGGRFDELGALFEHAELSLNGGEPVRGAAAVAALGRRTLQVYDDGTLRTKHVTSNVFLEVDEDAGTADARAYFTVLQAVPGFPLQPVAAGRYVDRFERVDGTWRFSARQVITELAGDRSHHVIGATA